MKKIAIMTYYINNNLGGALQEVAMNIAVEKLGYEAHMLAYMVDVDKTLPSDREVVTFGASDLVKGLIKKIKHKTTKSASILPAQIAAHLYDSFRETHLHPTVECSTYPELQALNNDFDAFICGSDQIWSPAWFDYKYYLPFVDDTNRMIAYAPSFGVSECTNEHIKQQMIALISRFKHLSVREQEGQELIRQLTGKEAQLVLDPTMLLDSDEWTELLDFTESDTIIDGQYILCYFLSDYRRYEPSVQKIAEKMGIPAYMIPIHVAEENSFIIKVPFDVGPKEFIHLLKNAAYVCTDSFHGTVFSILFNKNFTVFEHSSSRDEINTNSRLYNIIKLLKLDNRLADYADFDVAKIDFNIDYSNANAILAQKRSESKQYLKTALESATLNIENGELSKSLKEYADESLPSQDLCCGCTACETVCPTEAITVKLNCNGFRHYYIDKSKCINCGQCTSVCPLKAIPNKSIKNSTFYSGKSTDKGILTLSSSGGAGHVISSYLNKKGYAVCGCEYDVQSICARHSIVEPNNESDLRKFQGSKYIQSNMSGVYKKILEQPKAVFFGTPCQVSGLNNLLMQIGKRDNYVLVELICHAVPSLNMFRKYISGIKAKHHIKSSINPQIQFRNRNAAWGELSISAEVNGKTYHSHEKKDDFYAFFLSDISDMESCYECPYRLKTCADIKIGDYWGERFSYDKEGVSLIIAHTERGESLLKELVAHNLLSLTKQQTGLDDYYVAQIVQNYSKPLYYYDIMEDLKGNMRITAIRRKYLSGAKRKQRFMHTYHCTMNKIRRMFGRNANGK